jgi:hypothetical protein
MKNTEPAKFMTTSESFRKLVLAHFEGEGEAFRSAAREYIQEERRKNHHVVARDLERLLASYNGLSVVRGNNGLSPLPGGSRDVPKDKERDVALIEMLEPARRLGDLVLDEATRRTLERIVDENRKADLLKTYGSRPANRILFCGPPGCGRRSRPRQSRPNSIFRSRWSASTPSSPLISAKPPPICARFSILRAAGRWWCCSTNSTPSARTAPRSKNTARLSGSSIRFCRFWTDSAAIR